jgi:D-lactate dehydrogenase
MINSESLKKMKEGVMIINTGRGALIDTPALIDALKTRHVGSAGLDVYEEEEDYFFEDFSSEIVGDDVLARLLTFPNVLVTSHQAFFTEEALTNIAETTLTNIEKFFETGDVSNEICYRCDGPCRKKAEGRCW